MFHAILTYSLPPMLDFVYSCSVLNCPRIRVCSINLMALMSSLRLLRIARRLFRTGEWPNSCLLMSLSFLHLMRMCVTVCRPSLHSHIGSITSGTLRLKRKSLSPIFSVRSCTRSALCFLLKPWWSWSNVSKTWLKTGGVAPVHPENPRIL